MIDWTGEAEATLRRLRGDGLSSTEVAKRMGVSRSAICGKMKRLGLVFLSPQGLAKRGETQHTPPRAPRVPRAPARAGRALVPAAAKRGTARRTRAAGPAAPMAPAWPDPAMLHGVPLHRLKAGCCRWPLWDREMPGEPGFGLFCAADAGEGQAYCPAHAARATAGRAALTHDEQKRLRRGA